jgi:hypothetical protein
MMFSDVKLPDIRSMQECPNRPRLGLSPHSSMTDLSSSSDTADSSEDTAEHPSSVVSPYLTEELVALVKVMFYFILHMPSNLLLYRSCKLRMLSFGVSFESLHLVQARVLVPTQH